MKGGGLGIKIYTRLAIAITMATSQAMGVTASRTAPNLGGNAIFPLLVVDKASLQAHLQTLELPLKPNQTLQTFPVAIGRGIGDKQHSGDLKTPEGIYRVQQHIDGKNLLASKYGPLAIPLNFPNSFDRFEHKTGYGIWLHGAGEDKRVAEKRVTEGCVAFYNADIHRMAAWLRPPNGLVVIAKSMADLNRPTDVAAVAAATQGWLQAWADRDLEAYMHYYDARFTSAKGAKTAYRHYKQKVFASYHKMQVTMTHLRVITHPKYAMAIMQQNFQGDQRLRSEGRKTLIWIRSQQKWQILDESFDNREFSPIAVSSHQMAALHPQATETTTSPAIGISSTSKDP